MSPLPALIASYGWAHHCMRWLHENHKADFLLDSNTTIPVSTWFSGFGFAEWSLDFLAAARTQVTGCKTSPFSSGYQFERNARARNASQDLLEAHACQFIDIQRLLSKQDLNEVLELEKKVFEENRENVASELWKLLETKKLQDDCLLCGKHLKICAMLPSVLDISGSQCIHYSTLGKKVDGKLLRKNGPANKLLQIYVLYHSRKKTPLIVHENVVGFDSKELADNLALANYRYLSQICVNGADACTPVMARSRVYDIFILEEYWEVVDSPEKIYASLVEVVKAKLVPIYMKDAVWLDDENLLREEMVSMVNQNSTHTSESAGTIPVDDWTPLLSPTECDNYIAYLKMYGMHDKEVQDRELKAVAVSQNPSKFPTASNDAGVCCTFTTNTSRIMITNKNRWLTAVEKCAMAGLPVLKEFADISGTRIADVSADEGWHSAVGNGMLVANVGMVVLSVLASLKPKPAVLKLIADFKSAAVNQGLPPGLKFHSGWQKWKLSFAGDMHKFKEKQHAMNVHEWTMKETSKISLMSCADMKTELKSTMSKIPKKKDDMGQAVLRLRYRKLPNPLCICCESGAKDGATKSTSSSNTDKKDGEAQAEPKVTEKQNKEPVIQKSGPKSKDHLETAKTAEIEKSGSKSQDGEAKAEPKVTEKQNKDHLETAKTAKIEKSDAKSQDPVDTEKKDPVDTEKKDPVDTEKKDPVDTEKKDSGKAENGKSGSKTKDAGKAEKEKGGSGTKDAGKAEKEKGGSKKQEKTAYLPLSEKWFIEIGQGKKSIEVRAHTKYWAARLKGATAVLFSNGYTSQKLPPKKILSMDVTDWNGLKGLSLPQPGSKEYQKLFGAATEFLRIEFEKFNPGEVPQDRSMAGSASRPTERGSVFSRRFEE